MSDTVRDDLKRVLRDACRLPSGVQVEGIVSIEHTVGKLTIIVQRALAAERAAALNEAECVIDQDYAAWGPKTARDFVQAVRALPRNRSMLDAVVKRAAGEARHEMNQIIGEYLGQDANAKSTLQMLGDAIAKARAEQRERDAKIATKAAGDYDTRESVAAAIRAQE
jgi:hypothetical protein